MDDKSRRRVVEEVASGRDVNRVAEKFDIQPASVWHLVLREAFRKAMEELGLPGMRADAFLRFRVEAQVPNSIVAPNGAGVTNKGAAVSGPSALAQSALEAAAALRRLADAAGT